ncbi:hypothetical protein GJV85_06450 [Sulfurimonas aquatica]|uniref:Uncharacterized protein n=1 Tax=Sulfurimonas aquatica TaxID=2672570 RepID=A0A975B035_9BACT|nr:hypothetical protein [Sulfurimonas aquatica]QSZ41762.1 hypothetical protein GJV85_06450 [Sulfurimonas aquatica]
MTNNETAPQTEEKGYEVISFEQVVGFNYTLPDEDEPRTIEREITFVWEESIEKFKEEHGSDKPYKVNSFKREREQKAFIERLEDLTDDAIEEVQEEIANKMKFGFEFSGQLHNDD